MINGGTILLLLLIIRPFFNPRLYKKKGIYILDFYYGRVVEVRVFAAEDVAEGIAYEVSIANHQVGGMMRMTVNPC